MWLRIVIAYFSNPDVTRKLADSKPVRYVARATVRMFLEAKQKMLDASSKQTNIGNDLINQVKEAFRNGMSEVQKKPPV
ncbi:hypothetical protein EWB00_006022 [Schistosoma japonicum]|uniref:Uncharacterized protein n=1 Tax=Schistosoma japonicum TaxID=6182 RepID=C1LJ96_SCHJA|nr:hypothetical protein KSF78_0001447 [Schistosoma japonicum]KAH8853650.1 hypothetical protein KSF78_0001447 [Schistosoma japonicum]TNN19824.1 hypothetical protein EWB00_006022 [Schistosoma japonicum]TNN19825.1 hypothetical protein EWB00_006022 [Schistosoma japonicum]CAX74774.1 hypothetical protein [Schistosoma japonicum]